jgi:hypothetical protein
MIPGQASNEPLTIPLTSPSMHEVNWILVIEKEATFNTLCESNFHTLSRTGQGMLVTVKDSVSGDPVTPILTLPSGQRLSRSWNSPVLALVL